jgi:pimeloyl-ACP methyl ester carboxylesterase
MNASANKARQVATRYLELPRPDGTTGRIAYDDRGEGPLVLLAPGMGMIRSSFRNLAPLLVEAGYRVVTTDYRGLGESDTGWDEYTSEATGADMAALLRHLDAGPALVYDNSYTAASAVHIAALSDAKDLLRGIVLSGPFVRDGESPSFIAALMAKLITFPPLTRPMWMAWFPHMFPAQRPDYKEYRDAVDANLREPGRHKVFALMCAGTHASAEAKLPQADSAVSGIPALVVMGTKDEDFPDPVAEARFVGDALHARVEMVEGVGHAPHDEAPAEVARLILDFDPKAPVRQ